MSRSRLLAAQIGRA